MRSAGASPAWMWTSDALFCTAKVSSCWNSIGPVPAGDMKLGDPDEPAKYNPFVAAAKRQGYFANHEPVDRLVLRDSAGRDRHRCRRRCGENFARQGPSGGL